jgi:hypothetical protein
MWGGASPQQAWCACVSSLADAQRKRGARCMVGDRGGVFVTVSSIKEFV